MGEILHNLARLPDWLKLLSCLLLTLLLGIADYLTRDLSLSLFYFIPIAFASWFIGTGAGLFVSVVCGMELFVLQVVITPHYATIAGIKLWNALMEVGYLLLAGQLTSKIRTEMEHTRQRALELEAVNKQLEIANGELGAFDYTVAHELRQPLNLVNNYCQVVDKLCGEQLPEDCRDYIRKAYTSTLRMNRLIDSLLVFSRMGHVEPHREMVDLCMLAHEVAEALKRTAPERQVDFRIADGILARGESSLLRVVLDNLLGNAWKYSSMRDHTVIEFGVKDCGGLPTYFVRDNGAGFAKKDAEKLFIPFQRLPGADKYRGFGIGLATVERIIRQHGGKVWAEGEPDKGACIYFTLSGR